MLSNLEVKFRKFISTRKLIADDQSVLLAVSGGVDSMVMLSLFNKIRRQMNLKLAVVHINHQLRGIESDGDEKFVKKVASKYNIPFYSRRVNVMSLVHKDKLTKQVAARQLRYESIENVRILTKSDVVATAHHADDNAETVLLNILRGTGIHGLSGIPPKRNTGNIVRPLLFVTRAEIENYAVQNNIEFRNDSSNKSLIYRRNELRHLVIPILQKKYHDISNKLNAVALMMNEVNEKLQTLVAKAKSSIVDENKKGYLALNIRNLKSEPEFIQSEIVVDVLNQIKIEPTEKRVEALLQLCSLTTGRSIDLDGTTKALRDRDCILFQRVEKNQIENRKVNIGMKLKINDAKLSISKPITIPKKYSGTGGVEYIDAEKIKEPLVLRNWNVGDWFIPLGMKSKKKLSDYFIDQKIPRYQKFSIPVLESKGDIVWICGRRIDERFKLTKQSKKAIRLTYQTIKRENYGRTFKNQW